MSNIKLDLEAERKKRPPREDATRIGSTKIEFQLELRNRFETLQELNDIDTMRQTISDMIQQSASRVTMSINRQQNPRIPSPTRALMTKRREIAKNGNDKQRIEYAEICKTIKIKAIEDIRKYHQEILQSCTSRAEKSVIKIRP